jgi:hypothetical protein
MVAAMTPKKKSRPLNLDDFDDNIDWDPVEAENSNLAKCMRRGIDQYLVAEVVEGEPVSVIRPVDSADFVVVGPNEERNQMWTLLFAVSSVRGDWLRPVTGWPSDEGEISEWERQTKQKWGRPSKRKRERTEQKRKGRR